ncbi:MAG: sulfate transporter [Flavobacteriales bacterium]|nr:sulfate transporter [Flavobacteriales bacterium]
MKNFIYIIIILPFTTILAEELRILSTTSTRDSGLYSYLLPIFDQKYNINSHVIATGTGHAIKNAENCNGDILITHAKKLEDEFVDNGYGKIRSNLMYNDFVLVGPSSDPIKLSTSTNLSDALSKIYQFMPFFISRGDESGTHLSELHIWDTLIKIKPNPSVNRWYLETGQGMGATLNVAVGMNAYTYTDRATWLKFKNKQNHVILFENDSLLRNQYGIVLISNEHCKDINHNGAAIFYNWITSNEGQQYISKYMLNNRSLFIPNY